MICFDNTTILQNNANQPVTALVDNPLYSLLNTHTRIMRHTGKLCVQSLVYKLVEGFAENIGIPNFNGVFLKLA